MNNTITRTTVFEFRQFNEYYTDRVIFPCLPSRKFFVKARVFRSDARRVVPVLFNRGAARVSFMTPRLAYLYYICNIYNISWRIF